MAAHFQSIIKYVLSTDIMLHSFLDKFLKIYLLEVILRLLTTHVLPICWEMATMRTTIIWGDRVHGECFKRLVISIHEFSVAILALFSTLEPE